MIKMILADDEPIITRGIRKLVDWNSLGILVVGEFQDGKEALDGILTLKPDIALLDIYMPKMNGTEILRELRAIGSRTQVIFISGFQDFQYAKDALRYGAADYLLKPVIKDELIASIERCCAAFREEWNDVRQQEENSDLQDAPYDRLIQVEESTYIPVLLEILWDGKENRQEQKLIRFSVISLVEQYLEETDRGIVFVKNQKLVMVLKEMDRQAARETMFELFQYVKKENGHRIGAVVGDVVESMSQIPEGYARCLEKMGYFFFEDQIGVPILMAGEPVFLHLVTEEAFDECRRQVLETVISQDADGYEKWSGRFFRNLCIRSEGKKEDACFHFCTAVQAMEERFKGMGLQGAEMDVKEILEQGRSAANFRQMTERYRQILERYRAQVRDSVVANDKKDILYAKKYMEEHYSENLTLEVLAQEIHMNPYYFSSFFKKNSGENFKDYLNKVRMRHAMNLLVSTDLKTYEIADRVGFRDARSFSELFQRMYGETPASYRKRVKR